MLSFVSRQKLARTPRAPERGVRARLKRGNKSSDPGSGGPGGAEWGKVNRAGVGGGTSRYVHAHVASCLFDTVSREECRCKARIAMSGLESGAKFVDPVLIFVSPAEN